MAEETDSMTGHNGGDELTASERSALRMDYILKLVALDAEMKPFFERRKELRGQARAHGYKLSEIDAGKRLLTMEDQSIFVAEIKELIEIAQAFNALPPGDQGTLFPDRRPADERCFDEGKVAGMEGKSPEPPYGADSKKGQKWLEGWHDGQRVMREDLQAAMEKRNAMNANSGDPEGEDEAGEDPFDDEADRQQAAE